MVSKVGPEDFDLILKFGGGLHTRASEDEIDDREATAGQNFVLDLENRELRNRKPFDLIGTVPNAASIRGGASLLKADGTVTLLVQAGNTVYEWDGSTGFTSRGTVNASARLRGHWRTHQWTLGDLVLITDLGLLENVKSWDGTTLSDVTFTDEASAAFGTFSAKYLIVSNERAIFGHVKDPGATTRHMMVGSKRTDYTNITIVNRPSSSLSEIDPFFILMPDLKPINGMVDAFGSIILSTEAGEIFNLTGTSAKDFAFQSFYPGSFAVGEESLAYIGNDVVYGRQGRIESIRDTDRFGDVESDDLTVPISDVVQNYTSWTNVYNARLNRVYAFPSGQSEVWTLQTALLPGELSPWSKWTTQHALAFQPTFVMPMLDPSDGLEYVFMGDGSGNFYRMEGTGSAGDGGSQNIVTEWTSKLFGVQLDAAAYKIEGTLTYRKSEAASATITLKFSGTTAYDESITITIPAISGRPVFGGGLYFGGGNYFGTPFNGRFVRQKFAVPGQAEEFQVKVKVEGTTDFRFREIRLRFTAASG